MNRIKYEKLPGRGLKRGIASLFVRCRARLWLGTDHVLCQYTAGYREEYRRFYFRDIQAIAVGTSGRRRIINSILIALSAFFFGLAMIANSNPAKSTYLISGEVFLPNPATAACLISGTVFLLFAAVNTLMGPTSKGYLITAVTKEELPSLGRIRTARRAINILRPLIEGAQGGISREGLMDGLAARSLDVDSSAQRTHVRDMLPKSRQSATVGLSRGGKEETGNDYTGTVHMALFAMILFDAFLVAIDLAKETITPTLLALLSALAVSVLTIVCLIKQHGSSLSKGLKGATWGALAYMIIGYMTGFVLYTYLLISSGIENVPRTPWEQLTIFANYPADQDMFVMVIYVLSILMSLTLGIVGTLAYLRNRRAIHRIRNKQDARGR